MKTKVTLATLIKSANIPAKLIRAVVKQLGGWKQFTESAPDISNHGIDGGFAGFIYHVDTCAFTKRNRATIAQLAEEQAEDFGQGVLEMIQSFRCIGPDFTTGEIARCLYGRGDDTTILNGLAWYAAEEVARAYVDATERE